MNAVPAHFESNTTVNERFVSYLDKHFAPRDPRRWYAVVGLTVGSLLTTALLIVALLRDISGVWPLLPFTVVLAIRGIAGIRQMQRSQARFQDLRRIVQNGVPVTGYVVQAHQSLLQPGDQTLPCTVLFSFQPEVDGDRDYMRYLADRIYALKGKLTEDADRRFLSGLTTEDCPVFYRRRRLPHSFTDGSTIYCADLWVKQAYLKDKCLKTNMLPCLAEMGEYGGIELVPAGLADPIVSPPPTASPIKQLPTEGFSKDVP